MPVVFDDEAPPAQPTGKVVFDDEPSGTVKFDSPDDDLVHRVFDNPLGPPASQTDWERAAPLKQAQTRQRKEQFSRDAMWMGAPVATILNLRGSALPALKNLRDTIRDLAVGSADTLADLAVNGQQADSALQSIAEGVARGTYGTAEMFRPLADHLERLFDLSENEFIARKWREYQSQSEPLTFDPYQDQAGTARAQNLVATGEPPAALVQQWRAEYPGYRRDQDYQRYLVDYSLRHAQALAATGQEDILPHYFGTVNQQLANGASLFDATTLASAGAGKLAALRGFAAQAERPALAAAAKAAGEGASTAGNVAVQAAELPGKLVKTVITGVAGEDAAKVAEGAVKTGEIAAAVSPDLKAAIPLPPVVQDTLATAGKVRIGGAVSRAVGDAAQAVGRSLEAGPSKIGWLTRITEDPLAPAWVRSSAGKLKFLEQPMALAGEAAANTGRGAAGGAAMNTLLAGIASEGDLDKMSDALFAGAMFGATGGALNTLQRSKVNAIRDAFDATREYASRTPEERAAMDKAGVTQDGALKLFYTRKFIQGVGEGNATVRIASTPEEIARLQGGRGFEFLDADGRPSVLIDPAALNDGRVTFHEIAGHVLARLLPPEQLAPVMAKLFGSHTLQGGALDAKGNVAPVRDSNFAQGATTLQEGIFPLRELQRHYDRYLSHLPDNTFKLTDGREVTGRIVTDNATEIRVATDKGEVAFKPSDVKERLGPASRAAWTREQHLQSAMGEVFSESMEIGRAHV